MNSPNLPPHPLAALEASLRAALGDARYRDLRLRHRRLTAHLAARRDAALRAPAPAAALPKIARR